MDKGIKIETNQGMVTINDDYVEKDYSGDKWGTNNLSSLKHELKMHKAFNSKHRVKIHSSKKSSYRMDRMDFSLGDESKPYEAWVRRMLFSITAEEAMEQLDEILKDLESCNINHTDINPGNLLFSEKEKCLKLIDFYWAVFNDNPTEIGRPEILNRFYGDDKKAIDLIKSQILEISKTVDKEVTNIINLFKETSGVVNNDGSFVGIGNAYHPIDIPGFNYVPSFKQICKLEYKEIKKLITTNIHTTIDIGCSLGYFTFNLMRDFHLKKAIVFETDPAVLCLLRGIKDAFNLYELDIREKFDDNTIIDDTDLTIWMNSHMWVHKAIGEERTKVAVKNVLDNSKITFFQTAGAESGGTCTVKNLCNVDDISTMLKDCGVMPDYIRTTTLHGGKRHLFKVMK